jgi:nitrogen fixation NifU-like protein
MSDESLDELYQDLLLDHFKHPRNFGVLKQACCAQVNCTVHNPLCGDQVHLSLAPGENGQQVIGELAFAGHGCSISQASASMMTELCKGKTVSEARHLLAVFRDMLSGKRSAADCPELGDALALEGVRKFSARVKFAHLAWEALDQCLSKLEPAAQ